MIRIQQLMVFWSFLLLGTCQGRGKVIERGQQLSKLVPSHLLEGRRDSVVLNSQSKRELLLNHVLKQNNRDGRNLQFTGHLWDACIPGTGGEMANAVYQHSEYDDAHQPLCECFVNTETTEIHVECELGDQTCDSNGVCSGTHDIFFFDDADGDLHTKYQCHICYSEDNCTGVREICTGVKFDDNNEPEKCVVLEFLDTGATNECDECNICRDLDNKIGILHNCFGQGDGSTCDTVGGEHIHNFVPSSPSGSNPVPGTFQSTCKQTDLLYDSTTYDDDYSKMCDCDDPSSGSIVCDLYLEQCFANLCTDITEVFFFNAETGAYEEKMTCNWDADGICTMVKFQETYGVPYECKVLGIEAGELVDCASCQICETKGEGFGVKYDCFGDSTLDTCVTKSGHATFNLPTMPIPTSPWAASPPSSPQKNPTGGGGAQPVDADSISEVPSKTNQSQLGIILGVFFGGFAIALLIAFVVLRQRNAVQEVPPGAYPTMYEEEGVHPPGGPMLQPPPASEPMEPGSIVAASGSGEQFTIDAVVEEDVPDMAAMKEEGESGPSPAVIT